MSKTIVKYITDRRWAWVAFKYLVLPLMAAWDILRNKLPELVSEYRGDVAELDTAVAAYRASLTS